MHHDIDHTLSVAEFGEEEFEAEPFADQEFGAVFDRDEEYELAAELLAISDDEELEQFLGALIKKAGRAVGKFAKSSTGRALGGILKKAAKTALPILGAAAGTALGGPVGTAIGGNLAAAAGKAFGLELEGLSPDEQELEAARGFVRFAAEAAKKAAIEPARQSPSATARHAAQAAAQKFAPGFVGSSGSSSSVSGRRSGRWMRRGSRIILLGA